MVQLNLILFLKHFPSSMAVDYPLVLYDCHFEGLSWKQENEEVNHVLSDLQQHWTQSVVQTHVIHGMIQGLEAIGEMFNERRTNSDILKFILF